MPMSFVTFAARATAALLDYRLKATVRKDNKEWWLSIEEPDPPVYGLPPQPRPLIVNIPVIRDMLDTPADVEGFVQQAVAMAREEFEAAKISREIDRNMSRSQL